MLTFKLKFRNKQKYGNDYISLLALIDKGLQINYYCEDRYQHSFILIEAISLYINYSKMVL